MKDDMLWQDEEFDQVPTEQLLIMLHDTSRLVRARALATLARRSSQDETLAAHVLGAITDSANTEARLLGSTISIAHIGFAGLWAFGTPTAKKSLQKLLQHWAEPDRTDLLWFLKSQSISTEVATNLLGNKGMATDWKVGDRIGDRWEVRGHIRGRDELNYHVHDIENGQSLSLRTLSVRLLSDTTAVERFRRKAELWINLDVHPHLLSSKFFIDVDYRPCLFCEPWHGKSLAEFIGVGPLEVGLGLQIAAQLCDAMHYMHTRLGPVELGVSAADILIREDDVLMVADFAFDDPLLNRTTTRTESTFLPTTDDTTRVATDYNTEPNQEGVRADIHSFGGALCAMFTGESHSRRPPALSPDMPPGLVQLVRQCTTAQPVEKYTDFLDLRQEIERLFAVITGQPYQDPAIAAADPLLGFSLLTQAIQKGVSPVTAWITRPLEKASSLLNLGRTAEAVEHFDQHLKIRPDDGTGWLHKGVALSKLGRHWEAIDCYDQALKIDPADADAWNNKGLEFKALGHPEEAAGCYDRALEVAPAHHLAWRNRGDLLLAEGQYEEALDSLSQSLYLKPREPAILTSIGRALYMLGRYMEATQSLEQAIEINSNNDVAYTVLGACYDELGNFERALECFDRSLALNRDSAAVWNDRGILFYKLERIDEAFQSHEEALSVDPELANAWVNKGRCLAYWELHEEALVSYARAIDLDPNNAMSWNNQGHSLMACQDFLGALHSFDHAVELDLELDIAWFNRGAVLVQIGNYKDAINSFRKVLRLNPAHPNAAQAIRIAQQEYLKGGNP